MIQVCACKVPFLVSICLIDNSSNILINNTLKQKYFTRSSATNLVCPRLPL